MNEYSAQEALDLLMRKLKERNESLALQVQAAIDVGKDVSLPELENDRRKNPRYYRKKVRFTQEEALEAAVDVLQAYAVEQPRFVESISENLKKAAVGILRRYGTPFRDDSGREDIALESINIDKAAEIELQTETQISSVEQTAFPLRRTPRERIDEQCANIARLRELISFKGP